MRNLALPASGKHQERGLERWRRTDVKRGGEAILLDAGIRGGGNRCREYLRLDLDGRRGLDDVGCGTQADGAMPLAVVPTGFIYVRGERGTGQEEDDRERKRQALEQFPSRHGLHLHLERLDDS